MVLILLMNWEGSIQLTISNKQLTILDFSDYFFRRVVFNIEYRIFKSSTFENLP